MVSWRTLNVSLPMSEAIKNTAATAAGYIYQTLCSRVSGRVLCIYFCIFSILANSLNE